MAAIVTAFEWLLGSTPTSGAIDVVAIKNADGSIKCSPFHVKLAKGKKDVRLVKLTVNGKETDLKMKVGRAGEAFFVEHTGQHEYITRRLRSSPPASPGLRQKPADGIEIYHYPPAPSDKKLTEAAAGPLESVHNQAEVNGADDTVALLQSSLKAKDVFTMSTLVDPESQYVISSDTPPHLGTIDTSDSTVSPRTKHAAWTWTWGDLPIKSSKNQSKVNFLASLDEIYPSRVLSNTSSTKATVAVSSGESMVFETIDNETPQNSYSEIESPLKSLGAGRYMPSRMFSLCGDILSRLVEERADHILSDSGELFRILRSHAVSRHDFFSRPTEFLFDPNLVVLVGETLLTWPVAKVMFETVMLAHHELVSNSEATHSDPAEIEEQDDVLRLIFMAAEEKNDGETNGSNSYSTYSRDGQLKQPCWAGKNIARWFSDERVPFSRPSSREEITKDVDRVKEMNTSNASLADDLSPIEVAEITQTPGSETSDIDFGVGLDIDRTSLDHGDDPVVRNAIVTSVKCGEHIDHADASRKAIGENWEAYLQHNAGRAGQTPISPMVSSSSLVQFFQDNHLQDVSLDFLSSYHSFIVNKNTNSSSELSGMGTRTSSFFFPNVKDSASHQFFLDHIPASYDLQTTSLYGRDPFGICSSRSLNKLWTWGDDDSLVEEAIEIENDKGLYEGKTESLHMLAEDPKDDKKYDELSCRAPSVDEHLVLKEIANINIDINDNKLNLKQLSLLDISLEDICPGPARGEMYGYQQHDSSDTDSYYSLSLDDGDEGAITDTENGPDGNGSNDNTEVTRKIPRKYLYRKSLVPTQQQLESMNLHDGENEIIFEIEGSSPVTAQLFLWAHDARLVVADIEGMILNSSKTKASVGEDNALSSGQSSNGWGSLFFSFGSSGSSGVPSEGKPTTSATQLLHDIAKNGYHIVYLATKSMTQSSSTKIELVKATEKSSTRLPPGPVFLSPDTLVRSFESQRPDLFKAAVLRGTRSLFPPSHNPFYSGFCANVGDMQAFSRCGFPEGRIFLASETSEIKVMNRTIKWTYKDMHTFLDEVFPTYSDSHVSKCGNSSFGLETITTEDAYNDFNFWKTPIRAVPS